MTESKPIAYRPLEAARAIGLSRTQLDRLIARGEIRSFKVGGARFITDDELRRWVNVQQEKGF